MDTVKRMFNRKEIPSRITEHDIRGKLELYRRAENENEGGGQYIIDEIREYEMVVGMLKQEDSRRF